MALHPTLKWLLPLLAIACAICWLSATVSAAALPDEDEEDAPWPHGAPSASYNLFTTRVDISWAAVAGAQRYQIQWSKNDGTHNVALTTVAAPATSHSVAHVGGVFTDGEWLFSVRADDGGWSPLARVTVSVLPPQIRVRSSLNPCVTNMPPTLSWKVSNGIPPYTVWVEGKRMSAGQTSVELTCGALPSGSNPAGAQPVKTFQGQVVDSRGLTTVWLNTVKLVAPARPSTPTTLRGVSVSKAVRLGWTASAAAPPLSAYELQYQAQAWNESDWPGSWTVISETIDAGATSFLHAGLDPDRRYRYRLRASNSVGASDWSPIFPADGVQPKPGAPTLSAQTAASGSVKLTWEAGPASTTRREYRHRRTGADWDAWTEIADASGATTSHKVSGLTEDARYSFQLRAANAGGAGLPSVAVTVVAGLTPTVPSDRETLLYDILDSSGGATRPGSYAFLTDSSDMTNGATTFAQVSSASALLLNTRGYQSRDYANALATVQVGDRVTWFPYSRCWYHFRIAELLSNPAAPTRKLVRIVLETERACGSTTTALGDRSVLDMVRDKVTWFEWNESPPSAPDIGPDGIRILPDRYPVEGGHTYRLTGWSSPTSIVIDVPPGMRLTKVAVAWQSGGYLIASYEDEASGRILALDPFAGSVIWIDDQPHKGQEEAPAEEVARLEAIAASVREIPLP